MIVKEIIELNGKQFQKHYSDKGLIIRKVGTQEEYSEAIDLVDKTWKYEETDELIEKEEIR